MTQRNASGAQSEGRAKVEETRKRRGPEHYKSRSPLAKRLKAPADEEGTGILQCVYRSATTCLK
jgi:hypothetical protein